jgi:hypothetical protein
VSIQPGDHFFADREQRAALLLRDRAIIWVQTLMSEAL